jgi:hypothetical protein
LAERNSVQGELDDARATVDALTQRAERAEADAAWFRERATKIGDLHHQASDTGERRLEMYGAALEERSDLIRERDEALALVDARGRALEYVKVELHEARRNEEWDGDHPIFGIVADALSTTAAEALCQQQDREASLLVHMGTLRLALENERDFLNDCASDAEDDKLFGFSDAVKDITEALESTPLESLKKQQEREAGLATYAERARMELESVWGMLRAHHVPHLMRTTICEVCSAAPPSNTALPIFNLTPPATLAQQREYVGALEKVADAARCIRHWHDRIVDQGDGMVVSAKHVRDLWSALAALDAVKGGRS